MKSIHLTPEEITQIIAGEKNMCRKVVKNQPEYYISEMTVNSDWHDGKPVSTWDCTRVFYKCYPPFKVGEIIYCKEPWMIAYYEGMGFIRYSENARKPIEQWMVSLFKNNLIFEMLPAITMPEWASRCKIRITDIKCEKVNNIWQWVYSFEKVEVK